MAQPKSKCSEKNGTRKLEKWGGTMAAKIRAVKQAEDRAQIALRELEVKLIGGKESHKTECEV